MRPGRRGWGVVEGVFGSGGGRKDEAVGVIEMSVGGGVPIWVLVDGCVGVDGDGSLSSGGAKSEPAGSRSSSSCAGVSETCPSGLVAVFESSRGFLGFVLFSALFLSISLSRAFSVEISMTRSSSALTYLIRLARLAFAIAAS